MDRLTDDERPHFDCWLQGLADGDERLLDLLEVSLGRIAAGHLRETLDERGGSMKLGDLPASKPIAGMSEIITGWLKSAVDADNEWLRDVDAERRPARLMACQSYQDFIDEAFFDLDNRAWSLPGR
ncbi:hypothetical protein [Mesorhizobium sp. A623]